MFVVFCWVHAINTCSWVMFHPFLPYGSALASVNCISSPIATTHSLFACSAGRDVQESAHWSYSPQSVVDRYLAGPIIPRSMTNRSRRLADSREGTLSSLPSSQASQSCRDSYRMFPHVA
jgi:hypothetical protein